MPEEYMLGFCVGDVVELKSGSDMMTVERIDQPSVFNRNGMVLVLWVKGGEIVRERFYPQTLRKVRP